VRVELLEEKPRWARGRVVELLEAGPDRIEPPCPHYSRCGGCTLQHLTPAAQLAGKVSLVEEALRRIAGERAFPPPEAHPSPSALRYRNRLTLTLLRLPGNRVVAGLRELHRPERVLDLDSPCLLAMEPIAALWGQLREVWGPGARRLPAGRALRLTLRWIEGDGVHLVVEGGKGRGLPEELLRALPDLRAIWGGSGGREGASVAPPTLLAWRDPAGVPGTLGEMGRRGFPGTFSQVNVGAARLVVAAVREGAGDPGGRTLVDAYCGTGGYARWFSRLGGGAVAIEADRSAVREGEAREREAMELGAREGAEPPGGPIPIQWLLGRVEERLEESLPADLLILNPPRGGTEAAVMDVVRRGGPPRVLYVSCNPATLARDLGRLEGSYRIGRVQIVDLFPQTSHVETVLTLDRVAGPSPDAADR